MNSPKSLLTLTLATVGMFITPVAAQAGTLGGHLSSSCVSGVACAADEAYYDLFEETDPNLNTAFVAESRFGDKGGAAEKEFKIFDHNGGTVGQSNFNWVNGTAYNFKLSFDNALGWTYSLFNSTTNALLTSVSGKYSNVFNSILIRTRAEQGQSMVVNNLFLDGKALGDQSAVTSVANGFTYGVDYLKIDDVTGPFTLTGTSLMNWSGNPSRLNSKLAYQIKVVNLPNASVPEPTLVFGLGFGAFAMSRLRRPSKNA